MSQQQVPVRLTSVPEHVSIGSHIILKCIDPGVTDPIFKKNGVFVAPSITSISSTVTGTMLTFTPFTASDAGFYTCQSVSAGGMAGLSPVLSLFTKGK